MSQSRPCCVADVTMSQSRPCCVADVTMSQKALLYEFSNQLSCDVVYHVSRSTELEAKYYQVKSKYLSMLRQLNNEKTGESGRWQFFSWLTQSCAVGFFQVSQAQV